MSYRARLFGALAAIAFAGSASAASLPAIDAASYEGTYDAHSVTTGGNDHSFWLYGFIGGHSNYWQFDGDGGVFDYQGGVASLTGTIVNNSWAGAKFQVDASFNFDGKGDRAPKCEFGASACGSADYAYKSSFYEYFKYGTVTLTGLDDLAGFVLTLVQRGPDAQLGYGGNNKDIDEFGFSTWFKWIIVEIPKYAKYDYDYVYYKYKRFDRYGHGDINIDMKPIPVPPALPLMLGALGMMGWLARRRRQMAA